MLEIIAAYPVAFRCALVFGVPAVAGLYAPVRGRGFRSYALIFAVTFAIIVFSLVGFMTWEMFTHHFPLNVH